VSGRKGGSQGKELFGVLGRWEPDRKAGAVVKTRVGGQGEEELGSCRRAELLYALRVCNVSAIKWSLSSYATLSLSLTTDRTTSPEGASRGTERALSDRPRYQGQSKAGGALQLALCMSVCLSVFLSVCLSVCSGTGRVFASEFSG